MVGCLGWASVGDLSRAHTRLAGETGNQHISRRRKLQNAKVQQVAKGRFQKFTQGSRKNKSTGISKTTANSHAKALCEATNQPTSAKGKQRLQTKSEKENQSVEEAERGDVMPENSKQRRRRKKINK